MEVNVSWYSVDDFDAAKKFYETALGLTKTFEMDGWCEFSHAEGAASIGISQRTEPGGEGATVVLRVDDLERTRRELARRGVKFDDDIMEIPGVVRIATFHDPSGNRLQLCQVLMQGS